MQQIPANALPKDRQNDYRNAFIPNYPGWKIVSGDMVGQELAIIAVRSGEPLWLHALRNSLDLHSISAAIAYGDKWVKAAEPDCVFEKLNESGEKSWFKCDCKGHKELRTNGKAVNFGLAYGISFIGLANDLKIPEQEAKDLMKDYFKGFPKIASFLYSRGQLAMKLGYSETMSKFKRRRHFPDFGKPGCDYGAIDRAGKNAVIQGEAADQIKLALVYCRRWINDNNLRDKIKLVCTVHDQIDTMCAPEVAEMWRDKLQFFMEKAAFDCLGTDLLKAEVNITDKWSK